MTAAESKILSKAQTLFYTYSLRSVTMDDVAREAGVSKKTIYEYFEDKSALVSAVVKDFIQTNKMTLFSCSKRSTNAVEEVVLQVEESFAKLAEINYSFFYEIEKQFPAAWQLLVLYRQRTLLPLIMTNIRRGILEGYFRWEVELQFTAAVRLQQIATALSPVNFSDTKYTVYDMMTSFTNFYLHGITTPRGKELIHKYLMNDDDQESK